MTVIERADNHMDIYEGNPGLALPESAQILPSDMAFLNFLGRIEQDDNMNPRARLFAQEAREFFGLELQPAEDIEQLRSRAAREYTDDVLDILGFEELFSSPETAADDAVLVISAKAGQRGDAYRKLLDYCEIDAEFLGPLAQNHYHDDQAILASLTQGIRKHPLSTPLTQAIMEESRTVIRFQIVDEELELLRALKADTAPVRRGRQTLGGWMLGALLLR